MVCARSQHIDLKYWLIVDHVMKDGEVESIAGENMLADCFTKPHSGPFNQTNMS
jgi:hypothetical protein